MGLQSNTYFFFNRGLLNPQGCENAAAHVCRAVKDTANSPMFTEGRFETPMLPWEVRYDNAYPNVIYDEEQGLYHCYYTLCTRDDDSCGVSREERAARRYRPGPGRVTSLCYARSRDGVHWEKPALGFVEFEGSTDNNILFRYAHGTGVFLDREETDRRKRYKLVTKVEAPYNAVNYMAVNFSEDGVHWGRMIRWPAHNPAADSHNFPFRDPHDGKFKLITRIWHTGVRVSAICESDDFINWSEPREIARGTTFGDQVYSMPMFPYKGVYLGLASVFHEGDRTAENFDTVDLELRYGNTAAHLDPVAPGEPLIARGEGRYPDGAFDCGCIYAAVPLEMDGRLCVYYMGGNGRHTDFRETSFGRAFLEKDKFAFLAPRAANSEMIVCTTMMHVFGDNIELLCDIGEGGSVSAAYFDRGNGEPLEGFGYDDCRLLPAQDGYVRLAFGRSVSELRRASVCIKLRASNAKLYALRGDLHVCGGRYE